MSAPARRRWFFGRRKAAVPTIEAPAAPASSPPPIARDPMIPAPPANQISAYWASGRIPESANEWLDMMGRLVQPAKERSFQLMGLQSGSTVLDIGCGTGRDVARLMELVGAKGEVWGVDNNPEFIKEAKQHHPRGLFVEGDVFKLPFKDDFFDATRMERVLLHTGNIDRALAEMVRVTKPGGHIALIEPFEFLWYPSDQELTQRLMRHVMKRFVKVPDAGLQAYQQLIRFGLQPVCDVGGAVLNAPLMRVEVERPFATSHYSLLKPSVLLEAVEAQVITAAEAETITTTLQQDLADNTFLMVDLGLVIGAEIPTPKPALPPN